MSTFVCFLVVIAGILPLKEISEMFDKSVLEKLKSECGGLQTLLKNCPDVFLGIFENDILLLCLGQLLTFSFTSCVMSPSSC